MCQAVSRVTRIEMECLDSLLSFESNWEWGKLFVEYELSLAKIMPKKLFKAFLIIKNQGKMQDLIVSYLMISGYWQTVVF